MLFLYIQSLTRRDNMEKKELVLKALLESEEPLRPGDVVEKTGLSKEDVDKAIKKLKDEGKIESPKDATTKRKELRHF